MLSPEDSGKAIPASDLNHFEWLALEAAWAATKSPFPLQWEHWKEFPDIRDPQSSMGRVVGGNLWRANLDIQSADVIGESDALARVQLLSRAAGNIGKLAGGLIGTATHFETPPELWPGTIDTHLDRLFAVTAETLNQATAQDVASLDEEYYYDQLEPVSDAIAGMNGVPDREALSLQAGVVKKLSSVAINTWTSFMTENEGLALEPGATPRSAGQQIEDLRAEFERYVPRIREAASQRTLDLP